MITITHKLQSDLTLDLVADREVYIKIGNEVERVGFSLQILDEGGTASVQQAMESADFFRRSSTTHNDIAWEDIVVTDPTSMTIGTISADIDACFFTSPNVIYIKNTSAASQDIRVNLRAIR